MESQVNYYWFPPCLIVIFESFWLDFVSGKVEFICSPVLFNNFVEFGSGHTVVSQEGFWRKQPTIPIYFGKSSFIVFGKKSQLSINSTIPQFSPKYSYIFLMWKSFSLQWWLHESTVLWAVVVVMMEILSAFSLLVSFKNSSWTSSGKAW